MLLLNVYSATGAGLLCKMGESVLVVLVKRVKLRQKSRVLRTSIRQLP